MTKSELIAALAPYPDSAEITVSVDVSTGDDACLRAHGEIDHVQQDGWTGPPGGPGSELTAAMLICVGRLNHDTDIEVRRTIARRMAQAVADDLFGDDYGFEIVSLAKTTKDRKRIGSWTRENAEDRVEQVLMAEGNPKETTRPDLIPRQPTLGGLIAARRKLADYAEYFWQVSTSGMLPPLLKMGFEAGAADMKAAANDMDRIIKAIDPEDV